MKYSFALAVLASVAVARGSRLDTTSSRLDTSSLGKLGNDKKFNEHTAKYNISIKSVGDYALRQAIFRENDAIIEEQNAKSAYYGK